MPLSFCYHILPFTHMYASKTFLVSSSLTTLQTLRGSFGEHFQILQHPPGRTACKIVIDHRDYLQNLGVPSDRRYPSSSSLHDIPLIVLLDLLHAGNQYKPFQNGRIVDMFIGPSDHVEIPWDCRATLAYRLGFASAGSATLLTPKTLTVHQRRLVDVVDLGLEKLLTTSFVEKR